MNLGLGTLLCSHKTNPSVVQPYEPIPLIVLPHKLLACSKTSKPFSLGPWHAHNHHTIDSSPNNSQQEQNCSLPIVHPTHVITILRTPRHLAADENYQFHAHHASHHQAHPRPLLDLVLQAQTPHRESYNSLLEELASSLVQHHT